MINKVILVGNLGSDPEVKVFDNGNKVVNFSLATSESYKNKQGDPEYQVVIVVPERELPPGTPVH